MRLSIAYGLKETNDFMMVPHQLPQRFASLLIATSETLSWGKQHKKNFKDPYAIMVKEPLESLNSSSFNGLHLVFILFAKVNSILLKFFVKFTNPSHI